MKTGKRQRGEAEEAKNSEPAATFPPARVSFLVLSACGTPPTRFGVSFPLRYSHLLAFETVPTPQQTPQARLASHYVTTRHLSHESLVALLLFASCSFFPFFGAFLRDPLEKCVFNMAVSLMKTVVPKTLKTEHENTLPTEPSSGDKIGAEFQFSIY